MKKIYQVLDLKNEIEKFKYYLKDKYKDSTSNSIILNTFKVEVSKLYENEFLFCIRMNDYISFGEIKIFYKNIGDFEIEYNLNNEIFDTLKSEFDEYLNKLFKLNYRMRF